MNKVKDAIKKLDIKNKKYIFLGGYKGIIGSITEVKNIIRNGFYIDKETMLPYGIVEVIID